jgi:plastocyanin
MKIDITKLPVLEGVIAFLLIVTAVGFYGAFAAVNDDDDEDEQPSVSETAPPANGGTGGNEIAVAMEDNSFDPDSIPVAAGQALTFNVTNEGSAIHNMHIAGADNEYDTDDDAVSDPDLIAGGQDGALSWESPAEAAEIDFRCDFHPTDMTGTITVQ